MALGVVMLLDVVATLGGGVVTTLGHRATTLVDGASIVGGIAHLTAVKSWYSAPKYLEEVCCCCNGEVVL